MTLKGIIYQIVNTDNKVYVGSTTKELHGRMIQHKNTYTHIRDGNMPLYVHMRAICIEHYNIDYLKRGNSK